MKGSKRMNNPNIPPAGVGHSTTYQTGIGIGGALSPGAQSVLSRYPSTTASGTISPAPAYSPTPAFSVRKVANGWIITFQGPAWEAPIEYAAKDVDDMCDMIKLGLVSAELERIAK